MKYEVHIEADPNGYLRFNQGLPCGDDIGLAYLKYINQVNFSLSKGWIGRRYVAIRITNDDGTTALIKKSSPVGIDFAYAVSWAERDESGIKEQHHAACENKRAMYLIMAEKADHDPIAYRIIL